MELHCYLLVLPFALAFLSSMADQSRRNTATVYPYISPSLNAIRAYIAADNTLQQRLHNFFRILAFSIGFTCIISLIVWLIWLASIDYPQFRLVSLKVSNFSISTTAQYSGVWDANFIVRNPNSRVSVYCDKIEVIVMHNWFSISKTTVPPFLQGTRNKTEIRAVFPYLKAYVFDTDKHGRPLTPEKDHGVITVHVWIMVRVKPSARGALRRTVAVFCHHLKILVPSNADTGALMDGPKKCLNDWLVQGMGPPIPLQG